MNWEYLRSDEMKEAIEKSGGLCVMPIGCLEKHGPHGPLGTDPIEAIEAVERAAELEDVVIFPTGFWLGDMVGIKGHPRATEINHGAIALNPHTLLTVLEELCDEIARNGFRKILIVNSHGGNIAMLNFFLRCQGYKNKNYATMVSPKLHDRKTLCDELLNNLEDFPMLTDEDIKVLEHYRETGFGGGHADFVETARVMANHPELIAEDRYDLESGLSNHRCDYLTELSVSVGRSWAANYPNAFCGFAPHGCSQTIGQAIVELSAKNLARIFKVLKEDEECVRIATGQK